MARRFFVPPEMIREAVITVPGPLLHHLKVLRLGPGTPLLLADGAGCEREGIVAEVDEGILVIRTIGDIRNIGEASAFALTLCQGMPKGDKLELVLQKGTELGVSLFRPFISRRCVAVPPPAKRAAKRERWLRIVAEAARQSGAPSVPEVDEVIDFPDMLCSSGEELRLLLWEGEKQLLREVLEDLPQPPRSAAVAIGPEGGLCDQEAEEARRAGFITVSLGRRILRTETAGLAAAAILQYRWGELG